MKHHYFTTHHDTARTGLRFKGDAVSSEGASIMIAPHTHGRNRLGKAPTETCLCRRAMGTKKAGRSARRSGGARGFTLVETLVALTILATGLVSIMLVFPIALERQRVNTLRTMTTTVAQTEMGKLRAGDTDSTFHEWLQENRLKMLDASAPEHAYVEGWVVSSQPVGELNLGLYRVTIELRLWDGRKEYFSTYVTDR